MTTFANNNEGGVNGAAIPTPTVVGGDAWTTNKGASGTSFYTTVAGEAINSVSAKLTAGSAETNDFQRALTGTTGSLSFTYRPVTPTTRAQPHTIARLYAGATRGMSVTVLAGSSNTSASIKLSSNNADMPTITGVTLPCMIKVAVDPGTSAADGKLKWQITGLDGTTSNGTGMVTGGIEYTARQTTSGAVITNAQIGFANADTELRTAVFDDLMATDTYIYPSAVTNVIPTVASDGVVTIAQGTTTATITGFGDDTDGTISTFTCAYRPGTGLNVSTMATTPTIGPVTITSGAGTAHATFSFAVSGLTDGRAFFDIYAVDNVGANSLVGTARINKTELAPIRTGTTLVSITKITPTGGTNSGALNSQSTVPVLFETLSPPAVGSLFQEAFQPIDLNGDITFGQIWNIKNDGTGIVPTTVWVDLKEGGINGTVRATATVSINSYTPTFVGRTTTPAETASITDRSNLAVVGRFA